MIRAAIVDDRPDFRRQLRAVLDEETDIEVVASTDDPAVALAAGELDVVTVDPFAYRGRLEIVRRLSDVVPVLAISSARSADDVLITIQNGASGYVPRGAEPGLIVAAVRRVAAGEFYLATQLADVHAELDRFARTVPARPDPPAAPLSPREQEVLSLIARGFTHGQVATRLGVSAATVDTYVARIRTKLGLGPRTAALRRALEGLGAGAGFEPSALEIALTPREQELVSLVARGFTYAQIAVRLGVPPGAVAPTIARVRAKLGRHAAVALAASERRTSQQAPPPGQVRGRPMPEDAPMGVAPPGPDPAAEDEPPWVTKPGSAEPPR